MGSMSSALEQVSGRGANAIVYQAGKRMGHDAAKMMEKTDNLEQALDEMGEVLGHEFYFEKWKTEVVNADDCMACLSCHEICPAHAMTHKDIHVVKRLYIDRRVNHVLERII